MKNFGAFLLLLAFCSGVSAQSIFPYQPYTGCNEEEVKIFYINGIHNTERQAVYGTQKLRSVIYEKAIELKLNPACYQIDYAYNDSKTKNDNLPLNDLLESFVLAEDQIPIDWKKYWSYIFERFDLYEYDEINLISLESLISKYLELTENIFEIQIEDTLASHTQLYMSEPANRKIILVAHSQGNFYANLSYEQLAPNYFLQDKFKVVAVATPVSYVARMNYFDEERWTTNKGDIIQVVPNHKEANVSTEKCPDTTITIPESRACHSFKDSYLKEPETLNQILSHVFDIKELSKLNDTGIIFGANFPSGNNTDCSSNSSIDSQDCSNGRDLAFNDNTDGHAGFSFTKLDGSGAALPESATNWSCVRDNVTDLVWEVKTNDGGVHDKNNTYRWGGITRVGNSDSVFYSDWDVLVNTANSEELCGFNDWRVPNRQEMESIINYGSHSPAIDVDYFPNTLTNINYWSSTPSAFLTNGARNVSFLRGGIGGHSRHAYRLVRLVRNN